MLNLTSLDWTHQPNHQTKQTKLHTNYLTKPSTSLPHHQYQAFNYLTKPPSCTTNYSPNLPIIPPLHQWWTQYLIKPRLTCLDKHLEATKYWKLSMKLRMPGQPYSDHFSAIPTPRSSAQISWDTCGYTAKTSNLIQRMKCICGSAIIGKLKSSTKAQSFLQWKWLDQKTADYTWRKGSIFTTRFTNRRPQLTI